MCPVLGDCIVVSSLASLYLDRTDFRLNLSTEFLFQVQAATIGDLVLIFRTEGEGIWRMQIC
jgi:hypothetical protein